MLRPSGAALLWLACAHTSFGLRSDAPHIQVAPLREASSSPANEAAWPHRLHLAALRVVETPGDVSAGGGAHVVQTFDVDGTWHALKKVNDTPTLFGNHYYKRVASIEEWRTKWREWQPFTFFFYHTFVLVEFDGGGMMCLERYKDKVEVMFGPTAAIRSFAVRYRATGDARKSSSLDHRTMLHNDVELHHIEVWLHRYARDNKHSFLSSNSQHFVTSFMPMLTGGSITDVSSASDRSSVIASLAANGLLLRYESLAVREDLECVLIAVEQNGLALEFAGPSVRGERGVVLAAMRQNGFALRHSATALRADREVVLAAVREDGRALQYVAPDLLEDRKVVLAAVQENGEALHYAPPALREDREVVLAAVRQCGRALLFAMPALKADRDVVIAAMEEDGRALDYATASLREDRALVLAAVKRNGRVLKRAPPALREDREVVLAAVRQNGEALDYAAPALREDLEVLAAAGNRSKVGIPARA